MNEAISALGSEFEAATFVDAGSGNTLDPENPVKVCDLQNL